MTDTVSTCGLTQCQQVCPSNITTFQSVFPCEESSIADDNVVTLKILTADLGAWIQEIAERFSAEREDVSVEVVIVPLHELSPNIINEAISKTGLFDGFVANPGVMGSIVEEEGWSDLKPYIDETTSNIHDWSDILLSYRKHISQYQNRILMFPLDGDVLSLFYRKDILEAFGLGVPRTWDEYAKVAAATHGRSYNNKTLSGSCVGRRLGCAGSYWANLILSSMTQVSGTSSGHLFDSSDMAPLLGDAMDQALQWLEAQAMYGADDEFDDCLAVNDRLNEGTCVMTYNWGNTYAVHLNRGSVFTEPGVEMGVAKTPGSTKVLDRKTMKLVPCDSEKCRFGTYYDDIGWVNDAPYLAFGGWSCAVNNYTTKGRKRLATEFCAYAASREESSKVVVANATTRASGADPFRTTHLNVDLWENNGYDRNSVIEYISTIGNALQSENCVTDIRFPGSSEIYRMLDAEVFSYLNTSTRSTVSTAERAVLRKDISARLQISWERMIVEYNSQPSTKLSILSQYQRLRNVNTVKHELNQLGPGIRSYGYSIASFTVLIAIVCGVWTYRNRTTPVVKASQPFFLILISVGVVFVGASIFPMAVDDGIVSIDACHTACMAVPWLLALGWSILFAALYAKIRRVNLVIRNAMNFRSVQVTERDVMTPFAILFTANLTLLLIWTFMDPLLWERRSISETESYGSCTVDSDSVVWKVIVALLFVLNLATLIGANIEAWKARKVDTEYGESNYIGLIMASMLQAVLVGVPLGFLVQDNPTARFFVSSSIAFVCCLSVVLLLFVPKTMKMEQTPVMMCRSGRNGHESTNSSNNDGRSFETEVKRKVEVLEHIMREAGIDPSRFIREAGLHLLESSVPSTYHKGSLGERDSSSGWRENSLAVVEEEIDLPSKEAPTPDDTATRRSITKWLEKKRTENGSSDRAVSESLKTEFDEALRSDFFDQVRVDMSGTVYPESQQNL